MIEPTLVLKVVLLCCSAAISGSETALFRLSDDDARRIGPRAVALLAQPRELLTALLALNVLVNTLFFAFAATAAADKPPAEQWLDGLIALALVVSFGEVIPKNLALRAPFPIARVATPVLTIITALSTPLSRTFQRALDPLYRALGPAGEEEIGIASEALERALRQSAEQGLLLGSEATILSRIVELEDVRVREVMVPRVDLQFLDVTGEARGEVTRAALDAKVPWVIVIDANPDRIVGRVRTRNLLVHPARPVREMLEPCVFVPEVASALAALHYLKDQHVAQGVVIDEWGGTAGLVTVEGIFEEVVGDLRVEGEEAYRPVVEIERGRYDVDGSLSIRDWNQFFGQNVAPREFETVGGLCTALLGRVPKVGDVVESGPLEFTVRRMSRRRVQRLEVRVRGVATANAGEEEPR
ncbi:MAG: hemolysin family protein [Planctomycetota bacterium]|nr:hemolysin family protein [Planctomycetota bacterium]